MLRLNWALAAWIALPIVSSGLACSSQAAKSDGDDAQMSWSPKPSTAAAPASTAVAPASTADTPASPAMPGGKIDAAVKDPDVIEAAIFACTAEQVASKAQGHPQAIKLVKIIAAQSQVVAGISYTLTLSVKVNGQDQTAEAVVWSRPWLTGADKFTLTSWTFAEKE